MNKMYISIIIAVILIGLAVVLVNKNNTSVNPKDKRVNGNQGFMGLLFPVQFQEKLDTGEYVVLDVRTPEEYAAQKIQSDAVLVDFYSPNFKEELNQLSKDKKYLVHCRSGSRSASAVRVMQQLGFSEFYELQGGINAWSNAELPTTSG